jgi:hypothetical protein
MTDVLVKPAFQSAIADSGDATKLGPNSWNAARLFSAGTAGDLVVRDTVSATGAAWVAPSTIAAPAGLLTGATLAANVLASSLTSLGTIASLSATKGLFGDGTAGAPSITLASIPTYGFFSLSGNFALTIGGVARLEYLAGGQQNKSDYGILWSSGTVNSASDTGITRLSAGVVAVGTGAQGSVAGSVDAAGYRTAGVVGVATFGPAAVASITVKGGIVTAIS